MSVYRWWVLRSRSMKRILVDPARVRIGTVMGQPTLPAIVIEDDTLQNGKEPSAEQITQDDSDTTHKTIYTIAFGLVNNAFIEFLASTILLYSAIYVPHFPDDPLAQLIPGVAIVAVMMTLKDRTYFCPDGSFMVTFVLLCAGAYTKANKGTTVREKLYAQFRATQKYDVLIRWFGQFMACVMVYCMMVVWRRDDLVTAPFHQHLGKSVLFVNEFLATAIECIATSFCIMPLLTPYVADQKKNNPKYSVTFASKEDTKPPANKNLFSAAISLAVLHIVLDRLFRTTMNPFVFYMHCEIMGSGCLFNDYSWVYLAQGAGLLVAGLYSYNYLPPDRVLKSIFEA